MIQSHSPTPVRSPFRYSIALALVVGCASTSAPPPLPTDTLAPRYTSQVFENGLTVVAIPVPGAPLVGLSAFVTTGGRTETAKNAGALHFIEHLVFRGGTPRFPPTSFRKRISSIGDESGGWTWDDEIQFGFEVPSERFSEALDVFAEALMELEWTDQRFKEERQVVLQEIDTTVAAPWTRLWNAFDRSMFERHPYGRAVIGDRPTIEAMDRAEIEAYYRARFVPNHLVIVMAGNVGPSTLSAVGARFARYAKGVDSFELPDVQEEPMTAARRTLVRQKGATATRAIVGIRTPGAGHADTAALLVLGELVASPTEGLPSLLQRESGWVSDFGAEHGSMVDYGQLTVRLEVPTERAETVITAVTEWLAGASTMGFSEAAVAAAARHVVVGRARAWERRGDLAQGYGMVIERAGLERAARLTTEILAQTPESIAEVAGKYLKRESLVTALLLPEGQEPGRDGRLSGPSASPPPPDLDIPGLLQPANAPAWAFQKTAPAGDTHRFEMANGLVLLVRTLRGTPLVATTAYTLGGQWLEPAEQAGLAVLTGRLVTAGTQNLPVRDWDRVIADRALEITTEVGGDDRSNVARNSYTRDGATLALGGTTADLELMIGLLGEALFRPTFPRVEVEKAKEALRSEIAAIADDDLETIKQSFYDIAYANHPYSRPTGGSAATVGPLTVEDVRGFHERVYAPDRIVVSVVGDVDPERVAQLLASKWADVDRAPAGPMPVCLEPEVRPESDRDKDESRSRPLFCINLGAPALAGADPDVPAVELLMAMARGRHFYKYVYDLGVSYRSWVRFWPHRGKSPWIVENDLDKTRFAELVAEIEADVAAFARGSFSDEDLRVAKDRLVIQTYLDAQRTRETAFAMSWGTSIGRPWDALENERAALRKVTIADIKRLSGQLFGAPARYRVLSH